MEENGLMGNGENGNFSPQICMANVNVVYSCARLRTVLACSSCCQTGVMPLLDASEGCKSEWMRQMTVSFTMHVHSQSMHERKN